MEEYVENTLKKKGRRRIALFFFEARNINTYPAVTNTLRLLSENGFYPDIYLPPVMKPELSIPNTHFFFTNTQNPCSYVSESVAEIEKNNVPYCFAFAFSLEGLAVTERLNRTMALPSAYYSMELLYGDYIGRHLLKTLKGVSTMLLPPRPISIFYRFKKLFIFALYFLRIQKEGRNHIKFSVIQDEKRGDVLKKEFTFVDKMIFVPNSYIGCSGEASTFLHDRFEIPLNKKVLLFSGGVEKGFDLDLFNLAGTLPSSYVLFINAYSRDGYLSELRKKYAEEIDKKKLYISEINLSDTDYDLLVRSAHICIAWYPKFQKKDLNMYYMGLSSGKLCKYLSCGKPVVAHADFFGYPELIDGNKLGKTCNNAFEIADNISEIERDYIGIRGNIERFYLENVEYGRKFGPVLDELKKYA